MSELPLEKNEGGGEWETTEADVQNDNYYNASLTA